MLLQFKNKRISSIISVIPANEVNFMDEIGNYSFTETQMKKLKKVMGFDKRRVSLHGETVSDYAIKGISTLIEEGVIKENEIGAIVVTTTSPDYFIPPTSNVIQGHFHFDMDTICIDTSQGCCGFVVGLVESFMLLDSMKNKKVLLITGDMLSHKVSRRDRASRPITGDGVAISVIENSLNTGDIYASIKNNGKRLFQFISRQEGRKFL